jgi:hypothetical protein
MTWRDHESAETSRETTYLFLLTNKRVACLERHSKKGKVLYELLGIVGTLLLK